MGPKWKLRYEGPRLSHMLAKHIFLNPYQSKELFKLTGFQDKDYFWYSDTKTNLHGGYYTLAEMQKSKVAGLQFFKDKEKYSQWIKRQQELHQQTKELMEKYKLETEINNLAKEQLARLIPLLAKIRSEMFYYVLSCQPQCTEGIADEIKNLITVSNKGLAKEIFIKLTLPKKKSFFTKEELAWLDIAIKAKEGLTEEINNLVIQHHKKYFLIPASDRTESWELEHFTDLLKNNIQSKEELIKKKKQLEEQYNQAEKIKEDLVINYNLPKEAKELGNLAAEIGYYRFLTSYYGRWIGYYLVLICRKVAKDSEFTFEELSSCDEKELIEFVQGKKALNKEELSNRALAHCYLIKDHKIKIKFGVAAIQTIDKELKGLDYSKITELKGEIASLGKVTGKAFVFYWHDDLEKKMRDFPEDAILVAPQTHPAFMPVIRKAKAMVTDEGGITGHAAIVAREFRKPCVIGLNHVTKVVKTGDLIELDANQGIVRILKRALS